jgi:hypothetical protein
LKQGGAARRLTGMRAHLPGLIWTTARTALMVAVAMLLILGLLPVLAAQAAGGG